MFKAWLFISKKYNAVLDSLIPSRLLITEIACWNFAISMGYVLLRSKFLPPVYIDEKEILHNAIWDDIYYMLENSSFLLFIILARCFIPVEYRKLVNFIVLYQLIRVLWEISSPITNQWETAEPMAVTLGFLTLLIGGFINSVSDLKKRLREMD